jgi:hypothetical protein
LHGAKLFVRKLAAGEIYIYGKPLKNGCKKLIINPDFFLKRTTIFLDERLSSILRQSVVSFVDPV